MTKETILRNAALEVEIKSQQITNRRTPEEARAEYDRATGYVCALYDAKVFGRDMYQTSMDLLRAAYHAALQTAEKKVAPSAENTEGGKAKRVNHSIAIIFSNVKRGGELL